jgi:hypothetical protein
MVEKVTEIDVLCRSVDMTDDPIVVEAYIQEPRGVVYPHWDREEMLNAFSGFLPDFKAREVHVSEFLTHGSSFGSDIAYMRNTHQTLVGVLFLYGS